MPVTVIQAHTSIPLLGLKGRYLDAFPPTRRNFGPHTSGGVWGVTRNKRGVVGTEYRRARRHWVELKTRIYIENPHCRVICVCPGGRYLGALDEAQSQRCATFLGGSANFLGFLGSQL